MALKTKTQVKATVETGDNPTQQELYDWIESCSFQTEWKYYILSGNTLEAEEGNWRDGIDGSGNLIRQKYKSAAWVTVRTDIF